MTTKQLQEWEIYDAIDPIGKWTEDYRFASLQTLIINIVSKIYAKKGSKPELIDVYDLMPKWYKEDEDDEQNKQSIEDMKKMLQSMSKINFGRRKQTSKNK